MSDPVPYIDEVLDPKTGVRYQIGSDPVTKTYVDTGLAGKASVYTVEDIEALTSEMCGSLRCGDIVSKEDATGKHAYIVTFKKDNVGLCLTYADASGYIETVSYDYVTDAWVYNSTDVFEGAQASEIPVGFDGEVEVTNTSGVLSLKVPAIGLYKAKGGVNGILVSKNAWGTNNLVFVISGSALWVFDAASIGSVVTSAGGTIALKSDIKPGFTRVVNTNSTGRKYIPSTSDVLAGISKLSLNGNNDHGMMILEVDSAGGEPMTYKGIIITEEDVYKVSNLSFASNVYLDELPKLGGTKLYKHTFAITNGPTRTLSIISTDPTVIELSSASDAYGFSLSGSSSIAVNAALFAKWFDGSGTTFEVICGLQQSAATLMPYYFDSNGDKQFCIPSGQTWFTVIPTDTVTPL